MWGNLYDLPALPPNARVEIIFFLFRGSLPAEVATCCAAVAVKGWLRDALLPAGVSKVCQVSWKITFCPARLPEYHRDPDCSIIATALVYDTRLAGLDSAFPQYTELRDRSVGA